ncbi:hypothetical protein BaRGS_00019374 [Batillaria attramentaria]|uniref:Otopetrin n=1 Tax=Batillaria attramentaria TaxID=370345 RepID=A0ABD0KRQ8_9CAEN
MEYTSETQTLRSVLFPTSSATLATEGHNSDLPAPKPHNSMDHQHRSPSNHSLTTFPTRTLSLDKIDESGSETDDIPSSDSAPSGKFHPNGILSKVPTFSREAGRVDGAGHNRNRRKSSIFMNVLRRVSIHRRESSPSGRIATFHFSGDKSDADDNGMYGITIVVMGAVIPLTEIFVEKQSAVFEVYYIFLYCVSILFLAYVYAYLLRRNRLKTAFLSRALSRSLSFTRSFSKTIAKPDPERIQKLRLRKRSFSVDMSNHHTGTFYLRLGVLGFGIGSMIHSGLNFGKFFGVSEEAGCNPAVLAVKPVLHLVFTFSQLYFIFMNSKMCIHRYKKLARFGLMHMAATNICVWFRCIVVETMHEIHGHHHDNHDVDGHVTSTASTSSLSELLQNVSMATGRKLHAVAANGNGSAGGKAGLSEFNCQWTSMMSKAVDAAAPYLYPCTIEFSLMCAGILYVMWKNYAVGQVCPLEPRRIMSGRRCDVLIIYTVSIFALAMASWRMRNLTFHSDHKSDLEETLILISYTGLLAFNIFSLIASVLHTGGTRAALTIVSNLTMMIQAGFQTIFMLAGDRLSAANEREQKKKTGREFVTFLLLCNFAMWIINTFETQKPEHNPLQVEFYGPDAWSIFSHISVPLGIYYRFHSTVCLSNIWKNAWKIRKHH